MKDKLKSAIKKILKVSGIITFTVIGIGFTVGILGASLAIIFAGIVIAIPITLIIEIKKSISNFIEVSKLKKELEEEYTEYNIGLTKEEEYKVYNNRLKEKEKYQKNYAVKRANSIQIVKDQNNQEVLAEELVPLAQKEVDILKRYDILIKLKSYDIKTIKKYETIKEQISKETNKTKLKILKQQLTKLSFQMQDIATINNPFLNKYKTSEEIYKNQKKIKNLNQNKKLSIKFLKGFKD